MNLTPSVCPVHGVHAVPMLDPRCWWCPRGHLIVLRPIPRPIPRPIAA